jgi:hypothetical protein
MTVRNISKFQVISFVGCLKPFKDEDQTAYLKPQSVPHGFGGLVVSMLASGTQDRRFAPGQSHRIFFRAKKSSACLSSEGK